MRVSDPYMGIVIVMISRDVDYNNIGQKSMFIHDVNRMFHGIYIYIYIYILKLQFFKTLQLDLNYVYIICSKI